MRYLLKGQVSESAIYSKIRKKLKEPCKKSVNNVTALNQNSNKVMV